MSLPAPDSDLVERVVDGPVRVGSELRWNVILTGGEKAVLAQLLPELAREQAVRRRYTRDVERRAELHHQGVAVILDRSVGSADVPPWRLRSSPLGQSLADWIARRAPAPVDEIAEIGANLADVLHDLHRHGVVVRDLHPRYVILTAEGPVLTDIGLARVDLLSTRTAASLILEGSPYASPEQLRKTVLDQRSDLFGLGVILFQMLTDTLPYGEGAALLLENTTPPTIAKLRANVPETLAACVRRCLEHDPELRPGSAGDVAAVLRGESVLALEADRITCQSCAAQLRQGQRLCVVCGKEAVLFTHLPSATPEARTIVLKKVKEDAVYMASLREVLESVSALGVPPLNFLIGDKRMYSKEEQQSRLPLPIILFDRLDEQTANALAQRFKARGVAVDVAVGKTVATRYRWAAGLAAMLVMLFALGATGASTPIVGAALATALAVLGLAYVISRRHRGHDVPALLRLRDGPAALPASDPLVARLAALIDDDTPVDVRERIGELALAVQRVVDHRAGLAGMTERTEVEMLTVVVEPVVDLIEAETQRLKEIDRQLPELDEGVLVRGLAAAEARGATETERAALLDALDRLRGLEEQRAASLHRLLEAASLLHRSTQLGLDVQDAEAEHHRQFHLALGALEK